MFRDRQQAGRLLAQKLAEKLGQRRGAKLDQVVVGLPRGGVATASEVALRLHAPLTVLVSKKIGAPDQPELAVGAVSSAGVVVLNNNLEAYVQAEHPHVEKEARRLTQETKLLEHALLDAAGLSPLDSYAGKQVIIVDDGVATGMTTEAALKSVKKLGASEIVLAVPVIAPDTRERLGKECDLLVTLAAPWDFMSVGQFYEYFPQLENEEVVEILKDAANAYSRLTRSTA